MERASELVDELAPLARERARRSSLARLGRMGGRSCEASGPADARRDQPLEPRQGPLAGSRCARSASCEVAYDHMQGDRFRHARARSCAGGPTSEPADCRYDQLGARPPTSWRRSSAPDPGSIGPAEPAAGGVHSAGRRSARRMDAVDQPPQDPTQPAQPAQPAEPASAPRAVLGQPARRLPSSTQPPPQPAPGGGLSRHRAQRDGWCPVARPGCRCRAWPGSAALIVLVFGLLWTGNRRPDRPRRCRSQGRRQGPTPASPASVMPSATSSTGIRAS